MDKLEYQNKQCYLEEHVVRKLCKRRTACTYVQPLGTLEQILRLDTTALHKILPKTVCSNQIFIIASTGPKYAVNDK